MSNELIAVTRLPVIEEQLRQLKDRWSAKVIEASSMVCTEETVQSLKGIRAGMRKEFLEADEQRREAKAKYMAPWYSVEGVFQECVKDAFVQADNILKETIGEYESKLKQECFDKLQSYFDELAKSESIDFMTLEQAMKIGGIKISMEDAKRNTPTRLMDAVSAVVAQVAIDMGQIGKMDDSVEIMAEYKTCLNVGKAVSSVQERKRRVLAEIEASERRKAIQERFVVSEDKVKAVLPPVETAASDTSKSDNDPVFEEFTFTVYGCTKSQLIKIRNYLKEEGINYG